MTGFPASAAYPFVLSVERLALPVHLGEGKAEREARQTVYLSLAVLYPQAPDAARQDGAPFLCYDTLCQSLLATATKAPVQLIEFLASELFRTVRQAAPEDCRVWLRLQKPLPKSLVGYEVAGAAVEICDIGSEAA